MSFAEFIDTRTFISMYDTILVIITISLVGYILDVRPSQMEIISFFKFLHVWHGLNASDLFI